MIAAREDEQMILARKILYELDKNDFVKYCEEDTLQQRGKAISEAVGIIVGVIRRYCGN